MRTSTDKTNDETTVAADEALMLAARQSQEAFTTLIKRHQQPLVNFFRRMGDYSYAEDLTQETFVRLFKYRDRYQPRAKFTTFLYTIARRTWIDHCRRMARRKTAYEGFTDEMEVRLDAGTGSEKESHQRIRAALAGLSEDMRTCVIMSIYQGFKYEEIATIVGIPLGTVKTRIYHAMRKLKDKLK